MFRNVYEWICIGLEKYRVEGTKRLVVDGIIHPLIGFSVAVSDNVVEYHGVSISVDNDQVPLPTKGTIARGVHEKDEIKLIEEYLPRDSDVIELGAGIGVISCIIDSRISSSRTHVALEPNRRIVELLRTNKCANDCRFKIKNTAYSPREKQIEFPIPKTYKHGSLLRSSEETCTVAATNVQSLITNEEIDDVALVVDIEGYEIPLLNEEIDVLARHCRWLLVEFHDFYDYTPMEITAAKELLASAGFTLKDSTGNTYLYVQ